MRNFHATFPSAMPSKRYPFSSISPLPGCPQVTNSTGGVKGGTGEGIMPGYRTPHGQTPSTPNRGWTSIYLPPLWHPPPPPWPLPFASSQIIPGVYFSSFGGSRGAKPFFIMPRYINYLALFAPPPPIFFHPAAQLCRGNARIYMRT